MKMPLRPLAAAIAFVGLLGTSGCSEMFDFRKDWKIPGVTEPRPQTPTRLADFWTDDVLTQPNQPPVRGFGGRIMFYVDENSKPCAVAGTVTIMAFDATENDPTKATPCRQYVFKADELSKHYSKSKLGHSYSFWLPWDEVGGPERQVTLMVRFQAKTGESIVSTPSRQTLSGTAAAGKPANRLTVTKSRDNPIQPPAAATEGVQQISYEEPVASTDPAKPKETDPLSTVTIDLPPAFAQSLGPNGNEKTPAPQTTMSPQDVKAAPTGAVRAAKTSAESNASSETASNAASRHFPARKNTFGQPRADTIRKTQMPANWQSPLPSTPRPKKSSDAPSDNSEGEK